MSQQWPLLISFVVLGTFATIPLPEELSHANNSLPLYERYRSTSPIS
jgi:hypothetical protein